MKNTNLEELHIFTNNYTYELQRKVEAYDDYLDYSEDVFPWEEKFPKGHTEIYLPENFVLKLPDKNGLYDIENAISLYENLTGMNETIASDPRLWTYLTHVKFWKYMKERWPVEELKRPQGRIIDRYHMKYLNLASLVRNGISRLWWYSHLTFDERRKDKYELTRILLSKADIAVGILERTFGSNFNIRVALLEFLRDNPVISDKEDSWRQLFIQVNLLGGVKNLPFLSKDDIFKDLSLLNTNTI